MNLELRFTLPNQESKTVAIQDRVLIGSLTSNEIVIRVPGVEPIHAMVQVREDGTPCLTDLGSQQGVQLNGTQIDIESAIKAGDSVSIGGVALEVLEAGSSDAIYESDINFAVGGYSENPQQNPHSNIEPSAKAHTIAPQVDWEPSPVQSSNYDFNPDVRYKNVASREEGQPPKKSRGVLFSSKGAKPSGNVLEVVCYWDDTVLDVDLFHSDYKGYRKCTIGAPPYAHFLAGGESDDKCLTFVELNKSGYKIKMTDSMKAVVRQDGEVKKKKGAGSIKLGKRDLAQISHGAIKYFIMFVKPPVVQLPKSGERDSFSSALISISVLIYLFLVPSIYFSEGVKDNDIEDDIWSVVQIPEKDTPIKPEPPPKPKIKVAEAPKPVIPPKPPEKKVEPPKPVAPKKEIIPKKIVKKTPKPVAKPTEVLSKKPPTPKPVPKGKVVATGTKKPDKKLPGRPNPKKSAGLMAGVRGGGAIKPAGGGVRRGVSKTDLKGTAGGANKVASGVNLSKLGKGVGLVLNKNGPGAIKAEFNSSAGGAGGGAGSAKKTYGLGGPGRGRNLAISGTNGAANSFGSGYGGAGGGQGGLGGAGLTKGWGRNSGGRANVVVPASDPVIAGGLSTQEVSQVIRANLNQIRHCYEQLLQRSPNAQGKVKVKFVVNANGRVGSAKIVSSDISDMVLRGCVTGKVKRWAFPQPRGGKAVTVNYPFVFNPL